MQLTHDHDPLSRRLEARTRASDILGMLAARLADDARRLHKLALKSSNDVHGHLAGAEAVRTVGRTIADRIPADAVACRYGGDEFVIALAGAAADAERLANDLRRTVLVCAPVLAGLPFPSGTLSISIGLACRFFQDAAAASELATDVDEGEQLFRMADAALYAAKNAGRNRVHFG